MKLPSILHCAANLLPLVVFCACVTAQSAPDNPNQGKKPRNTPAQAKPAAAVTSNEPAKIQEEFQNEFARQLAKAGPKSEGWALFSDSSMGHNGQRWYIKSNEPKNDVVTFCLLKQGETKCKNRVIPAKRFQEMTASLKQGDTLGHLLPTVFDGISFEYLHASNSVPAVKRVVFKTSATPFPEAYENLIKAFNP
jgi:hypothetical protein